MAGVRRFKLPSFDDDIVEDSDDEYKVSTLFKKTKTAECEPLKLPEVYVSSTVTVQSKSGDTPAAVKSVPSANVTNVPSLLPEQSTVPRIHEKQSTSTGISSKNIAESAHPQSSKSAPPCTVSKAVVEPEASSNSAVTDRLLDGGGRKPVIVSSTSRMLVNTRQRGNPVLKHVKSVPWEYADIVPDYQLGAGTCALYLSLRYHHLKPEYIHRRLKELGKSYNIRLLLVQVDVKDPHHSVKELAKIAILADCTFILAWSAEEVARYMETYKAYENKPPDVIMERSEKNYLSQAQECLTSIKSVNKTDAVTLLTTFGSMGKLLSVTAEEVGFCPGFGPQKARRLVDVFTEPFQKVTSSKPRTS